MDDRLELAQLLARFKLQVKRTLNQSVDLERLTRDAAYARQRLAEIEEDALEEELLVMVLRLRDSLIPAAPLTNAPEPVMETSAPRETRSYLMGARSW